MPKGSKTCKKCNHTCGPRAYECPSCGEPFMIKGKQPVAKTAPKAKRKPKKNKVAKVVDWKALPIGTRFKVSSGSGPYYLTNGERTYLSDKGYYDVHSILKDGIVATGEAGTFAFI